MEPVSESTLITYNANNFKKLNNGEGVRIKVIPDQSKSSLPLWFITSMPTYAKPNLKRARIRLSGKKYISQTFTVIIFNFI